MQRLCEYHFSDDPEIAPSLERLRPGSGLRDPRSQGGGRRGDVQSVGRDAPRGRRDERERRRAHAGVTPRS